MIKFQKSLILMMTLMASLVVAGMLISPMSAVAQSDGAAKSASSTEVSTAADPASVLEKGAEEETISEPSIVSRSLNAGPVVFLVLLCLISLSVISWAIAVSKWMYLKKLEESSKKFISSFWDSRSLNDLNSRLSDYPYSPVREVFRNGYAELVRGSQLKEQAYTNDMAVQAALENLTRALGKAKNAERRRMEQYLPVLAITASAAPFIGLFGTVWGIMNSFEGIARTGSASLAAVAPGISEALIATAFGLAAAIPAVIGYNMAGTKIRSLIGKVDGFGADYLNIVQRYLVSDRSKGLNSNSQTPRI